MKRFALIACLFAFAPTAFAGDGDYQKKIQPFFNSFCVSCHGGAKPKERLSLEAVKGKAPAALNDLDTLDRIAERIRSQTMPPPTRKKQPTNAERNLVVDWLNARIDAALGGERNPGRVTIRRLTKVDYRNTIRDLLDIDVDTSDFPSDDIAHGFDNLADVISLPPVLMERYADAAESISRKWFDKAIGKNPKRWPTKEKPGVQIASEFLFPIMKRAYRGPVIAAQVDRLLSFYTKCEAKGFGYRGSMEAALQYILLSPRFLFRIEKDGPIGQDRSLNDYELATRLSYFLWSTMPDAELRKLADSGRLQKNDTLHNQLRRMLKSAKIRHGLVDNFSAQWLQTKRLRLIGPDKKAFPDFDDELRNAMAEETAKVFERIVLEDRSILELLGADWTYVNERLARHYGMNGVKGAAFQKVSLKGTPRRGVLTHAGILALTSNPTRTSPVKRGRWIMEAILGTPPPPPVADAGELEAVKVSGTVRQRLEQHRANPRCASCHARMDPLGLAFEHFDAVGKWRTKEDGRPIDATGKLPGGAQFANASELIRILRDRYAGQFRKNLAKQMLIYALGRKLERYDRPVVRQIEQRMREGGDTFSSLVLAVVESDPFRKRRNPDQIGIEGLPANVVFDLSGNPDQQMLLKLRPRKGAKQLPKAVQLEVHSLKPLLRAVEGRENDLAVRNKSKEPKPCVYRYPLTVALDQPLRLFFMPGLIAPGDYSDDFLMPVTPFAETDQNLVMKVANWNQAWGADLTGPVNPRPGTVYSFEFDVRLVAKEKDNIDVWINIGGAHNKSVFAAGSGFKVVGEGGHRLKRVGRRTANMGGAWARDISVLIRTHAQTVVGNMSPIRFIRPKLGLSSKSTINLGSVAPGKKAISETREIFNAQKSAATDHLGKTWNTILYGTAQLYRPDKQRAYIVDTKHVGAELIGKHSNKFELVGANIVDDGRGLRLVGADKKPGLEGGSQPEREPFQVRFRGAKAAGAYEATLRIVSQAGRVGTLSKGANGEPQRGLYYVDIPVRAVVKN